MCIPKQLENAIPKSKAKTAFEDEAKKTKSQKPEQKIVIVPEIDITRPRAGLC